MPGKEKASLLLYYSWYDLTKDLTIEQKGTIYDAIFQHEIYGADYAGDDPEVKMALRFIFAGLDENRIKYQERCEKNRRNVSKRYSGTFDSESTTVYERSKSKRPYTNATDYGYGNDSDSDNDSEYGNGSGNDASGGWTNQPTAEEVQRYATAMGYQIDAQRWVDHWNGWKWGSPEQWQKQVDGWAAREWPRKTGGRTQKRTGHWEAENALPPDDPRFDDSTWLAEFMKKNGQAPTEWETLPDGSVRLKSGGDEDGVV